MLDLRSAGKIIQWVRIKLSDLMSSCGTSLEIIGLIFRCSISSLFLDISSYQAAQVFNKYTSTMKWLISTISDIT